MSLEFICVDSTATHETGKPIQWLNRITIKSRPYQDGKKRMVELISAPSANLRYTIDGTSPKTSGKPYSTPFEIPRDCQIVLAVAELDGVSSDDHARPIDWSTAVDAVNIDLEQAVHWKREFKAEGTNESFKLLDQLERYESEPVDPRVEIQLGQKWVTLDFGNQFSLTISQLKKVINVIRNNVLAGELVLHINSLRFPKGAQLHALVANRKDEIKAGEVEQIVSTVKEAS
jgi:hypothetical protein